MAKARRIVVVGLVGSVLDGGGDRRGAAKSARWKRWRPSVDLARHADFPVARFELLHQPEHLAFAEIVKADVGVVSPKTDVRLIETPMKDAWDFEEVYGALFDYASRAALDPEQDDVYVHITTGTHVAQICWFLLAESRRLPAKLLQTSPPKGRVDGERRGTLSIIDLDLSRYDALRRRFQREATDDKALLKAGIATRSPAYNALIDELFEVAHASHAPILLGGETGTGKTALARRIYDLKKARGQVEGAFVEANCATLRGDQAMSTLFGHKKGAFTGAVTDREGLLVRARGGVLFLDEVGELGLDEQAMLLRAIEEGRFLPLGADRETVSSFQLLCGTHRDLHARVREGRFREDLLARLDVWRFTLPPLRARPEDLAPNLDVELERAGARRNTRVTMSAEARTAFLAFAARPEVTWPGNFREFAATIERMATLAQGGRIAKDDVTRERRRKEAEWAASPSPSRARDDDDEALVRVVLGDGADALDPFDQAGLALVVRACRESRSLAEAGRFLFRVSRTKRTTTNDSDRVRKLLAQHGLTFDDVRGA